MPRKIVFAEERRIPSTNAARDAFLLALESETVPNAALRAAARRDRKWRAAREDMKPLNIRSQPRSGEKK
jgi:hypothetical protein